MEMVRLKSLKKWRALLAVLIPSMVSAIAPPVILVIMSYFGTMDQTEVGLNAAVQAFVTVLFGVVNFVSFSLGILCVRSTGKGGQRGGCHLS
jgi:hypothetical protein